MDQYHIVRMILFVCHDTQSNSKFILACGEKLWETFIFAITVLKYKWMRLLSQFSMETKSQSGQVKIPYIHICHRSLYLIFEGSAGDIKVSVRLRAGNKSRPPCFRMLIYVFDGISSKRSSSSASNDWYAVVWLYGAAWSTDFTRYRPATHT